VCSNINTQNDQFVVLFHFHSFSVLSALYKSSIMQHTRFQSTKSDPLPFTNYYHLPLLPSTNYYHWQLTALHLQPIWAALQFSRRIELNRVVSGIEFHVFKFNFLKTVHSQQSQTVAIHIEQDSKATKHRQLPISQEQQNSRHIRANQIE